MADVIVKGDTSGSVTLSAPAVAGTVTVTLPATSGTMAVTAGSPSFTDITATGNLTVNGNTTLGDASTDTVLITGAPSIGGAGLGMGMGFRNRIINGAMVIDQRNAGASVTPINAQYLVDRWQTYLTQASKFTAQQNAGSVTPPVGFSNYLGFTVGASANVTIAAGDYFMFQQSIEGFNSSDLGWGTANAKTVTISFWAYSSLTGTFGGVIRSYVGSYSYPFTYSIPVANTWTQISVTVVGPTSGTFVTTNGGNICLGFGLGCGSTWSGTAGSWSANSYFSATGAVSPITTNSATFYITGVQLEKGSTATSFDYRPYGTELQLCQRYYEKSYNMASIAGASTNTAKGSLSVGAAFNSYLRWTQTYKVPKRGDATFTIYSTTGASGNVRLNNASDLAVTIEDSGENASAIYVTRSWTLGDFVWWQWTASSEL